MDFYKKFLINLTEAESQIWKFLVQGTANKKSKFYCPTLSTIDGKKINSRTIILRKAEKKIKCLTFYTDKRSKKVKDIKKNKNVSIHIYDNRYKLQVQIYGKALLEYNSKKTKNIWRELSVFSKKNYMAKNIPGKKIVNFNKINYFNDETKGYNNFSLILLKINRIECLQLLRHNNIRAEFNYKKDLIIRNHLSP